MSIKKIFPLATMVLAVIFVFTSLGWTQAKSETKGPVITHSFAVEKGKYGYIWKIYLEAEDPDGDMVKIASVVDQVGYGRYPTDWTYIKSQNRKHFKGYLQWNTFSSKGFELEEWTYITLKVSVLDMAGNESNLVVFPFTFESGVKNQYAYKAPAPFDEGGLQRLGYIHIDLYDPRKTSDSDSRND